jgi:two-component system, OmpR family, KDP operon response regulator KdpE
MGRILIVDDEESLAKLLAWVLRQEGHEVFVAANAGDGIKLGLMEPPDLLITDWMLKHSMHGGEVARCIRSVYSSTRTIVITGHPEIVSNAQAWQEWIDVVIEKPFHMRHLFAAVRQLLREDQRSETHLLYQ